MTLRPLLLALLLAAFPFSEAVAVKPAGADIKVQSAIIFASKAFRVQIDPATGGVLSIEQPADPAHMSWISGPENASWQPVGSQWGLGFADLGRDQLDRSRWGRPVSMRRENAQTLSVRYQMGALRLDVTRRLKGDTLEESYRFTNTGQSTLKLSERGKSSFSIYTPFNDHYTNSEDVAEHRAHTHIWSGGAASWVAQLRMGGRGPHMGLVLTEGSLDGYSVEDRDQVTQSNTRGTFLLHPDLKQLAAGESRTIAWTLFWHAGWDDFFAQARKLSSQMVQIDASNWASLPGEPIELSFKGLLGETPTLKIGEQDVDVHREGDQWRATVPPLAPGERVATLKYGKGLSTKLVLNSLPDFEVLLAARVRFITQKQQWNKPGDAWDGAYIVYDNQLDAMVRTDPASDRNGGRERVGMGVLVAQWLRRHPNAEPAIRQSLDRYYAYVNTRLQRADGWVNDGADLGKNQTYKRLYNWPWVMRLHLEMATLTGNKDSLRRFMTTVESYYHEGGAEHYSIGMPIVQGLKALKAADMQQQYDRALALFIAHGDKMIERGISYPAHELHFEQSIVAPAANLLLDLHAATGDAKWLEAARLHVTLLEQFEGRQPDHHLNGIAIRHWDGYWFGKLRMWGDTFPHYWSGLDALTWTRLADATDDATWKQRAETTIRGNLSGFTADGHASAAFLYPVSINGRFANTADPYANDQDWTLVHALDLWQPN